jgi:hypothetical protein
MHIVRACALAALLWAGLLLFLNVVGLAAVPPVYIILAAAVPLAAPTCLALACDVALAFRYARMRRQAGMEWDPA